MCVKVIASHKWHVFWDTVYLCFESNAIFDISELGEADGNFARII